MADRIAVMNKGRVDQFATPEEIYDAPATLFVAGFVGTANLLRGKLRAGAGGLRVDLGAGGALSLPPGAPRPGDGDVVVVARPEHFRVDPAGGEGLPATVRMVLPHGPFVIYELSLADGTPLKVTTGRSPLAQRHAPGEAVRLGLLPEARVPVFPA